MACGHRTCHAPAVGEYHGGQDVDVVPGCQLQRLVNGRATGCRRGLRRNSLDRLVPRPGAVRCAPDPACLVGGAGISMLERQEKDVERRIVDVRKLLLELTNRRKGRIAEQGELALPVAFDDLDRVVEWQLAERNGRELANAFGGQIPAPLRSEQRSLQNVIDLVVYVHDTAVVVQLVEPGDGRPGNSLHSNVGNRCATDSLIAVSSRAADGGNSATAAAVAPTASTAAAMMLRREKIFMAILPQVGGVWARDLSIAAAHSSSECSVA
jgi:hypothetical protein